MVGVHADVRNVYLSATKGRRRRRKEEKESADEMNNTNDRLCCV
jgi:hypothetical protein